LTANSSHFSSSSWTNFCTAGQKLSVCVCQIITAARRDL